MTTRADPSHGGDLRSSTRRALRLLAGALLDDLDQLTDTLVSAVLDTEPDYGPLHAPEAGSLRTGLVTPLRDGLRALGGPHDGDETVDRVSRRVGRQRAREGVPLDAVCRIYRLGGRIVWDGLLAASRTRFDGRHDDELLAAASHVWRAVDLGADALADAYREEEARLSPTPGARHTLLSALVDGRRADPALARRAAAVLGLPSRGALVCVVAPIDVPGDPPLRSPRDVLAGHGIVSSWQVRRDDVVGLVVLADRCPGAVLETLRPATSGRAGISPVFNTLDGAAEAYALALTAAKTVTAPGIALLDDHLPRALLVDSPHLARRLARIAFGELTVLTGAEREPLLRTLDAVLGAGGSPTRAAQRLYCHRNTVLYRLRRIESLTGRRLSDPHDRLLLALALLADELPAPSSPTG